MKTKGDIKDIYPLSPMQEGMFFHYLYDRTSAAYFEQLDFTLHADMPSAIVRKSLNELMNRYEILRTAFIYEVGNRPLQIVLKEREIEFYFEDIRNIDEKEDYLKEFKEKDRLRSFDLKKDVLIRVAMLQSADFEYNLIWSFHHILMDGWCIGILIFDFLEIYNSYLEGRPYRLAEVRQYREYIAWLEKQDKEVSKKYWKKYLEHYEEIASLPAPRSSGGKGTAYRNEEIIFTLEEKRTKSLNELAVKNNVTLNTVIQAIWGILLGKYSGREDVVFGAVVSGRPPAIEGIETMIGLFINTIPLRVHWEGEMRVGELLQSVQESALESERHHYCSLAEIQAESPLKQELLNHIVVFENVPLSGQIEKIADSQVENGGKRGLKIVKTEVFEQTNYDFNLVLAPGKRLVMRLMFNANVYGKEFFERTVDHFTGLLDQATHHEDMYIDRYSLLSDEERYQILVGFNNTKVDYPRGKTIPELFTSQVERHPGKIALIFTTSHTTYKELDKRAERCAGILKEKGVAPAKIVGILAEKSVEMIVGVLGILKAGGTYLPVDPDYPFERIRYMLSDSRAGILLTTGSQAKEADTFKSAVTGHLCIDEVVIPGSSRIGKGVDREHLPNAKSTDYLISRSQIQVGPAYVSYTSGTTGNPRAVIVEHCNVVRLVKHNHFVELDENDRILQTGALEFDASTFEIWGSLLDGLLLCLAQKDDVLNAARLKKIIGNNRVTTMWLTSPLFNQLCRDDAAIFQGLKYLLVGGDKLSPSHINRVRNRFPGLKIVNGYGPTENTTFSTTFTVDREYTINIPIGKPIANSTAYIVDRYNNLLPIGVPGELVVGMDGVSRGYLNNPELTAEKFTDYRQAANSISQISEGTGKEEEFTVDRIYKTGDLTRWLPDGNIEFLGRMDHQVKIRGFRIELGEIESRLLRHEKIRQAVVLVKEEVGEEKYLCGYIVSDKKFTLSEIKNYLANTLPAYMIPSYFVQVEEIPLTANGKVDTRALPPVSKGVSLASEIEYIEPRNAVEEKLIEVWQGVLGIEHISIKDNFFMVGGDSIKTIQVAAKMRNFGYKIEMRDFFQYPTISEISPFVEKLGRCAPDQSVITGIVPLTPIQREFFNRHDTDLHHFNQAVLFYSQEALDIQVIKVVFTRIVEHHDMLRAVFKKEKGEIIQEIQGLECLLSLQEIDLRKENSGSEGEAMADVFERLATEIQTNIDLGTGPLMKLGLFHLDDGDRLLIVIHHLIIDGISWRILFEDIDRLYRQYKEGQALSLPPKSDSFKLWAEKINEYARSEKLSEERDWWGAYDKLVVPVIPKDFNVDVSCQSDLATLSFSLSNRQTNDLLKKVNEAFNTEITDILLTALGISIKRNFGINEILLFMEGHGRENIIADIDVSRTVGWFTSVYPVLLDMSSLTGYSGKIKEVKETLRKVPYKGIGYGILKYLTPAAVDVGPDLQHQAHVEFNYLGQFDADVKQMELFKIANESTGNPVSLNRKFLCDFSISGMVAKNRLSISLKYSKKQYLQATARKLLKIYEDELNEIIFFCTGCKEKEITPSDLEYKDFTIKELENFFG